MCEDSEPSAIEADSFTSDDHSDYSSGSSVASSTTSISSTVQQYLLENGRRYHTYYGPEKNLHPTDEIEQERLDIHHEVFRLILDGRLYRAPLETVHKALDIGTGTGIWAVDFADQHPEAEVIGTDLSPIMTKWVPPNLRFELDDAELPWTYGNDIFDFIHARNLLQSISDWPKVLQSAFSALKPGGYIEIADVATVMSSDDNSVPPDNPLRVYADHLNRAMKTIGRPSEDPAVMQKRLQDAGFVDVKVYTAKQPLGPWPKRSALKQAGALMLMAIENGGYHTYGLAAFTRILGMSSGEAIEICDVARDENLTQWKRKHAYNPFHTLVARKPE